MSKVCRELEVDKAAVAGQIAREQKRRDYRDRKKEERDLIAPPIREDSGKDREDELLLRQHPREMKAAERLLRYLLRNPDRAEALRDRVLLQRGLSGQELDISALGENLSPQAVDRLAKWQLPGAPPVTDEEAEDCLKCLRDYAARMSRDELGQLSGEALRQYIENLNREKSRRKEQKWRRTRRWHLFRERIITGKAKARRTRICGAGRGIACGRDSPRRRAGTPGPAQTNQDQ